MRSLWLPLIFSAFVVSVPLTMAQDQPPSQEPKGGQQLGHGHRNGGGSSRRQFDRIEDELAEIHRIVEAR